MTDEKLKTGQQLYWTTDKSALALALHQCGEKLIAIKNGYDDERLRKLGCESATQAHREWKAGAVIYIFEPTPRLTELYKIWRETQTALKDGKPVEVPSFEPEDAMRLLAHTLTLRADFNKAWHNSVPDYIPQGFHQHKASGENSGTITASLKIASINLSPERRAHLGV